VMLAWIGPVELAEIAEIDWRQRRATPRRY